ncbi:hypothetical protein PENTCL1PPCAC_7158, partial [Pristionchus entomophagus]
VSGESVRVAVVDRFLQDEYLSDLGHATQPTRDALQNILTLFHDKLPSANVVRSDLPFENILRENVSS